MRRSAPDKFFSFWGWVGCMMFRERTEKGAGDAWFFQFCLIFLYICLIYTCKDLDGWGLKIGGEPGGQETWGEGDLVGLSEPFRTPTDFFSCTTYLDRPIPELGVIAYPAVAPGEG